MTGTTKNDQVVIVTGASRGIGKTVAEVLLNQGFKVYGTSRNGQDVKDVTDTKDSFPLVRLDVNDDESVEHCINGILDREGHVDVLINNAGFGLAGPIIDTTIEEAKLQLNTNFFGVHRVIKRVVPSMIQHRSGIIINIGSFAGRVALPYQAFYSASKAALALYTDGLRIQLKEKGIKVALVEPGDIRTKFHDGRKFTSHFSQNAAAVATVEQMRKSEEQAAEPTIVAKCILKIIKSKKTKPRYLVGKDARMFGLIQRFVSKSREEKMILKHFKLASKSGSFKRFRPNGEKVVVLITGASSGIGKVTADYLASRGYTVYGTSRKGMSVQKLSEEDASKGWHLIQLDVNENDSVRDCVEGLLDREGKIDVLINNAGFPLLGVIWHTSMEQAMLQFETNFFGVHRMVRAVAPHMVERKEGCIINISSIAGRICMPLLPFYSASKAALSSYTDALRMELRQEAIKVVTVEPGFVRTDFDSKTVFSSPRPERKHKKNSGSSTQKKPRKPTKKGIHPQKVAKVLEKIILSRNPKPRYTVGRDAWLIKKVQAFTSRSLQEKMIMKMFRRPLRRILVAAEAELTEN